MATGDILSVEVRADGWTADITIEGLAVGGTYATRLGLGANNDPGTGTSLLILTATSLAYDDSGVATTLVRRIYGTKPTRKAYPDDADYEESTSGSNTVIRLDLSDYVYQKDNTGAGNSGTTVKYQVGAGLYTSSGTPNNAGSGTITNSSTVAHQKVVANWSWPGYQLITGGSFTLRCCAFHQSGREGRPVRLVRFSATDGTNTVTTDVLRPTVDSGMADENAIVEYIGTLSTSTLTQGATITCNFIAYPWVGDSACVMDTSTGTSDPTPLYGPKTAICDKSGTYGVTYAVVDAASGSDPASVSDDSGKWVGDGSDPGTGSGVTAYATIARAARAVRNYNSTNRSRDDVGAGVVYVKAGSYAWLGATISGGYGTTPGTWITIKPFPAEIRANCIINSTSGNTDISDRVKIENLTITSSTNNTFSGMLAMWFDQCEFNTSGTGILNTSGSTAWLTHSLITQIGQGLRPVSTANFSYGLIRGCDFTSLNNAVLCYTAIGNTRAGSLATSFILRSGISGMLGPTTDNFIIAYNTIYNCDNLGVCFSFGDAGSNLFGGAIVQNVIEVAGNTGSSGMGNWGTTLFDFYNMIIWHNTIVGQRNFVGYNETGTSANYRIYWSQQNNYWDRWANKGDTFFGGGDSPGNGNRIGAWTVTNNVGSSGNYMCQNMYSIPGNFYAEYAGINSIQPDNSSSGTTTEAAFVDRQSALAGVAGAGNGDYRLQSTSPLIGLPSNWILPYDLDGNARFPGDAAGAYTYGDPAPQQINVIVSG